MSKMSFNLVDQLKFDGGKIKIKGTGSETEEAVHQDEAYRPMVKYADTGKTYCQVLATIPFFSGNMENWDETDAKILGCIPQTVGIKLIREEV